MTRATVVAALATAAGALLVTGAAAQGPAERSGPSSSLASVETIAFEQPMDASRRPLGPRVRVSPEHHTPSAAALRAAASKPSAATSARRVRALQASSGCKTVWVTRIGRSILGFVVWKYTQEKYFCWSYPRVTSVQTNAYPCCTDLTWHWVGQIGSAGWFFTWAGDSKGAHYTFRQGRFEQTIAGKLIDSDEPWTKIWVYGNGNWAYDSGT